MTTIFIRTLFFYFLLTVSTRFMGKRQLGEVQITEFISVVLLSELAALPIADRDIPPLFGIIPLLTVASLEIIISFICRKSPSFRSVVEGKPIVLMAKGEIVQQNLTKARISLDEIFAETRAQGFGDISQINYIILEQTGKISILPKAEYSMPVMNDLGLKAKEKGMLHTVVIDGFIHKSAMEACGMTKKDVLEKASSAGKRLSDISYMTIDDNGNATVK
ncbi:MAG: DUF421 domain-containing protein [Clostridia bacterium]|nr:DUF421 domain-containing protein [Clostridia bacterium]